VFIALPALIAQAGPRHQLADRVNARKEWPVRIGTGR
jgi:hypothetical protein